MHWLSGSLPPYAQSRANNPNPTNFNPNRCLDVLNCLTWVIHCYTLKGIVLDNSFVYGVVYYFTLDQEGHNSKCIRRYQICVQWMVLASRSGEGEHHIPFELKSSFGTNLITVGDVWFYLEI